MSKPRYTDSARYPHGYSRTTDLHKTFERVRNEIKQRMKDEAEKKAAEQKNNVAPIKKVGRA